MTKLKPFYSIIFLTIIILISASVGALRFNSFQVGAFSDDAHYIVLAESISHGQGYRLINYPHKPFETAFPPGFPILLSPLVALFPGNYTILKMLSFALWLASIPLMYKLFAKHIKSPYLELLIALIIINPYMVGMSGMVMSEAAYWFFSMFALNLFDNWIADQHNINNIDNWLIVLAFSTLAIYSQLIRTIGFSILLSMITYLMLNYRFKQAGILTVIFVLFLVPQFWFNNQNGGSLISSGYESQVLNTSFAIKLGQIWSNLENYLRGMVSNSLIPIFGPTITTLLNQLGFQFLLLLANIFILLSIIGGIVISIKRFLIGVLYVGFYFFGILIFWNPVVGSTQMRFLIPIIPFLYFFFIQSIIWFSRYIIPSAPKSSMLFTAGITFLILLVSLTRNLQDWRNPIRNRITDLSIGTVWINENTKQDSIIMASDPVPDYLYARRKTIAYPSNEQNIENYIEDNNINYLIISPKLQIPKNNTLDEYVVTNILPVITPNKDKFKLVYKNIAHNVKVYQYLKNP